MQGLKINCNKCQVIKTLESILFILMEPLGHLMNEKKETVELQGWIHIRRHGGILLKGLIKFINA